MKLVKGDKVKIIKGKDKGREGIITRVLPKANKIVIEGVNVYKKHQKAKGKQSGEIVEVSRPLSVSNVMALCPKTKKTTRLGYKLLEGEKLRICKISGEVLPYPVREKK